MNRLNHVKVVTPEPEKVEAFLREVCDIPAGWALGSPPVPGGSMRGTLSLGSGGELPLSAIEEWRGPTAGSGYIAGSPESRQFQILRGEQARMWATCISTRDIESVHQRCMERGVPATAISIADWNERDDIRFFFCTVGGLTFEVIRVEPKAET
jgi:hypothetical protein